MKIQCPKCNSLTIISAYQFPELNELQCSDCGEVTILKEGIKRTIQMQFILTESEEKMSPEKSVETFRQKKEVMQPVCSSL